MLGIIKEVVANNKEHDLSIFIVYNLNFVEVLFSLSQKGYSISKKEKDNEASRGIIQLSMRTDNLNDNLNQKKKPNT